ncbi:MAG: nitroreductase family protein [Bacteroidales bacterium]|nr:nitroreductase family protein [Bacteroidales bacterium]MBN2819921.1 nitroreductase family protein [Bacteroidales bacterium]
MSIMTKIIKLPAPQTDFQFPLMKALELRRTKRKWKNTNLSEQQISNLLWAACGVTQPESKKSKSRRTAPSVCNSQEIKVCIALNTGVYRYDEAQHQLVKILSKDIRMHIGTQKMMKSAPVGLIYISDFSLLSEFIHKTREQKWVSSATDVGFVSQNVYLYCTAANLSTVVLGLIDRENLHKLLGLQEQEKIMYTQIVGIAVDK